VNLVVNTPSGGSGSAVVGGIYAGSGTVTLDTQAASQGGGAIHGGNGGALNVSAGTLNASAGPGGINLDTAVSNLTARVASGAATGNISIRNHSGTTLTLGSLSTSNGNITISNNQGITVGSPIAAGGAGSVTLDATGSGNDVFQVTPSTASPITLGGNGGTDTLTFLTVVPTSSTGTSPNKTYFFSGGYQPVSTNGIANEP
jgi:hypothetical protein